MILEDFPFNGETTKIVKMKKEMPIFIRFGHFQSETNERSLNWSTGEYEKGISVYPAILRDGKAYIDENWLYDVALHWGVFRERTQYVLTGKHTNIGSDGEPVLHPSSIVIRGVKNQKLQAGIDISIDFER